jgi:hypothetical protein
MNIHISKHDLTQCYRLHGTPERKHILIISLITLVFFGYILLTKENAEILIPLGLLGGTLTVLFLRYPLTAYKTDKIYAQHKGIEKEFEVQISQYNVTFSSDNGFSKHAWADFHRYKQNKHYLLLYLSDALFLMLPKKQIPQDKLNSMSEYIKVIEK